jgi:hypothetical protein
MRTRRGSTYYPGGLGTLLGHLRKGDIVSYVLNDGDGFSGIVRDVDNKLNKVTVAWAGGIVRQHDPEEVALNVHVYDAEEMDEMWGEPEEGITAADTLVEHLEDDPQYVGNPKTHGLDKPVGGGFSIMQNLQKKLHKESQEEADENPKEAEAAKAMVARVVERLTTSWEDDGSISETKETTWDPDDAVEAKMARVRHALLERWALPPGAKVLKKNVRHPSKGGDGSLVRLRNRRVVWLSDQGREEQIPTAWEKMYASQDDLRETVKDTVKKGRKAQDVLSKSQVQRMLMGGWEIYRWDEPDDFRLTLKDGGELTFQIDVSFPRGRVPKLRRWEIYMSRRFANSWKAINSTHEKFKEEDTNGLIGALKSLMRMGQKGSVASSDYSKLRTRRAMYWGGPGRTYRLTKNEQGEGPTACPRCKEEMTVGPFTKQEKIYSCGGCGFMIPSGKVTKERLKIEIEPDGEIEVSVAGKIAKEIVSHERVALRMNNFKTDPKAELLAVIEASYNTGGMGRPQDMEIESMITAAGKKQDWMRRAVAMAEKSLAEVMKSQIESGRQIYELDDDVAGVIQIGRMGVQESFSNDSYFVVKADTPRAAKGMIKVIVKLAGTTGGGVPGSYGYSGSGSIKQGKTPNEWTYHYSSYGIGD